MVWNVPPRSCIHGMKDPTKIEVWVPCLKLKRWQILPRKIMSCNYFTKCFSATTALKCLKCSLNCTWHPPPGQAIGYSTCCLLSHSRPAGHRRVDKCQDRSHPRCAWAAFQWAAPSPQSPPIRFRHLIQILHVVLFYSIMYNITITILLYIL